MPPQEQVNPSPPRVSFRGDNDIHQEPHDPQPAFPPHTMTNPRQYRGLNPPPQPKSRPRAPKATQRMVVKDPKAMPSAPAPTTNSSDFVAFPPTEITMSPKRNKNKQTSSSPNSNHERPPRSPARSPPMQPTSGVVPLRAESPSGLRQTAPVVQPSPPPMRQSASRPAAASSSPPVERHSQNPAPAPRHQAASAPNSMPPKQDVTRDRRPHAPWRRRGQALRRKVVQEDGNAFELSHSCSIDRYYKVAERVMDQFLSSPVQEPTQLIESYLVGHRLQTFLRDVLPQHPEHGHPDFSHLQQSAKEHLADLDIMLEDLALFIDELEYDKYTSEKLTPEEEQLMSQLTKKPSMSMDDTGEEDHNPLAGKVQVQVQQSQNSSAQVMEESSNPSPAFLPQEEEINSLVDPGTEDDEDSNSLLEQRQQLSSEFSQPQIEAPRRKLQLGSNRSPDRIDAAAAAPPVVKEDDEQSLEEVLQSYKPKGILRNGSNRSSTPSPDRGLPASDSSWEREFQQTVIQNKSNSAAGEDDSSWHRQTRQIYTDIYAELEDAPPPPSTASKIKSPARPVNNFDEFRETDSALGNFADFSKVSTSQSNIDLLEEASLIQGEAAPPSAGSKKSTKPIPKVKPPPGQGTPPRRLQHKRRDPAPSPPMYAALTACTTRAKDPMMSWDLAPVAVTPDRSTNNNTLYTNPFDNDEISSGEHFAPLETSIERRWRLAQQRGLNQITGNLEDHSLLEVQQHGAASPQRKLLAQFRGCVKCLLD